jgi:flagellar biogenesis protein FliO
LHCRATRGALFFHLLYNVRAVRTAARIGDMFRTTQLIAIALLGCALAAPLAARATPPPPDWQDGDTSVYLSGEKPGPAAPDNISTSHKVDAAIAPVVHVERKPTTESPSRYLAPPGSRSSSEKSTTSSSRENGESRRHMEFGIPSQSLYTIATGLTIVVGAFLVFAWLLRRGGRGVHGRRGMLPADAVSVLGRAPLAARQMAQLLRVGNKLVLVALTPNGAETLTEITDPVEVDRLLGLCQQHNRYSTTKAFEEVFQNLTHEPAAAGGFFGADSLPPSISPVAAAYRSHRGDRARV